MDFESFVLSLRSEKRLLRPSGDSLRSGGGEAAANPTAIREGQKVLTSAVTPRTTEE